ncbi:DUF11 domain-containing protein [Candidatus Acetothermia bacterium]|nr:DUF11 domain-containing protein [Candidatus Acetothermia bacterium]
MIKSLSKAVFAAFVIGFVWVFFWVVPSVYADCPPARLTVEITSGPYALVDSKTPGAKGPSVVTLSAVITNVGNDVASNVIVYIGDGTTPGTFKDVGNKKLSLLGGNTEATRSLGQLASQQSRVVFWHVFYPATFGVDYPYKVWIKADGDCSDSASATLTTHSSGSASTNRLTRGSITLSPANGRVGPGQVLTLTVQAFDLGIIGAGVNGEEAAWLQPVGNSDFDPTCFRLIQTEILLKGISSVPFVNELYIKGIGSSNPPPNYDNKPEDYAKYTFIALRDCSTSIQPYQQASVSTDEKYNGDYGAGKQTLTSDKKQGSLVLSKIINPVSVKAGTTVSETIFYGNTSNVALGDPSDGTPVTLVEQAFPDGMSYVANSMYCGNCTKFWSTDGGKTFLVTEPSQASSVNALKWVLLDPIPVKKEEAGTVGFQVKYDKEDEACTKVIGRIGDGQTIATEDACLNSEADLLVDQTGPTNIIPGGSYEFSVTYGNVGPSVAEDVVITDTLPPGATLLSATPSPDKVSSDGKTLTFNAGSVPAKQSTTLRIRVTADSDLTVGTALTNTVQGLMRTPEKNTQNNVNVFAPLVYATTAPLLRATETVSIADDVSPSGPSAGDTLEYTVTISNKGGASATSAVFRQIPSLNTRLVAGSIKTSKGTVNTNENGVSVNVGVVGPSEPVTIKFRLLIARPLSEETDRISEQGFISSNELQTILTDDPNTPVPNDATLFYLTPKPVILAYKAVSLTDDADHNLIVSTGDTLQCTVTLMNQGNASADSVRYVDFLSIGTKLVQNSVTTNQGTITKTDDWLQVDVGSIPSGKSVTISYKTEIAPLPAGLKQLSSQGIVTGANFASTVTDDPLTPGVDDPTVISVTSVPIVRAYLSAYLMIDADGDGKPSKGDTMLYHGSIVNLGQVVAKDVSIADTPDAHTELLPGSVGTSQGLIRSGNGPTHKSVQVNVDTLLGRTATEISFAVVISSDQADQMMTQAVVTGQNFANLLTDDPDTTSIGDTTILALRAAPVLKIFQRDSLLQDADGDSSVSAGDTLLYTVTITNVGSTVATGVVYSDTPDPNTTLVTESIQTDDGDITSGQGDGNTSVRIEVGKIGAHSSVRLSFQIKINNPLASGVTRIATQGALNGTNFASLKSDDPDTPDEDDETVTLIDSTQTAFSQAALTATQIDNLVSDNNGDGIAGPGDVIEYKIVVNNVGKGEALGVIYTDYPDPNTVLIVSSVDTSKGTVASGNNPNDTFVRVNLGQLGPGSQATLTYRVAVRNFVPQGVQQIVSQGIVSDLSAPATLTSDPSTPTPNSPTVTLLIAAPNLRATKHDSLVDDADKDGRVSVGDTLLYTMNVTNEGTATAISVRYDDMPDVHTMLINSSVTTSQGTIVLGRQNDDRTVAVNLGDLAPHATAKLEFKVRLMAPIPAGVTQISSQGHLTGDNFPSQPTEDPHLPGPDTPTVTWVRPELRLVATQCARLLNDMDHDGRVSAGDTLLYTVTIRNDQNEDARDVTYRADLDENLDLMVSNVATSDGVVLMGNNAGDRAIEVNLGTILGHGGIATVSFQAVIAKPLRAKVDQISMQGRVTGANSPEILTDDADTQAQGDATVTPISDLPAVEAFMSAFLAEDRDGNGSPSPGDVLEYVVNVVNRGLKSATGVAYKDEIVAHTAFITGSIKSTQGHASQGSDSTDSSVHLEIGTLPPGSSVRLSYRISISDKLPLGVSQITKQGQIVGENFQTTPTQDPKNPTHAEATVTTLTAFYVNCGDVDNDGKVTLSDSMIASQIALGILPSPTPLQLEAADVTVPFGIVDSRDATVIAEIALGIRVSCPLSNSRIHQGKSEGDLKVISAEASSATVHLAIEQKQLTTGEVGTLKIFRRDRFTGLQAGPHGGLQFNPKVIQVREARGVNGFTLLAQEIDNEKGFIKFLLVALNGLPDEAGSVLELDVEAIGPSGSVSPLKLDLDSVLDEAMRLVQAEVEEGSVQLSRPEAFSVSRVLATPSPVHQGQHVEFVVEGAGIKEMNVIVWGINGSLVMGNVSPSNRLDWNLLSQQGQVVANGVYLYVVRVRGFDGKFFQSKVQKLVIIR